MSDQRHELLLPDLGIDDVPLVASQWLVEPGQAVLCGDRLLEIVAGCVTVDLPAPADGTFAEALVCEDDVLAVGQLLGIVIGPAGEPPSAAD